MYEQYKKNTLEKDKTQIFYGFWNILSTSTRLVQFVRNCFVLFNVVTSTSVWVSNKYVCFEVCFDSGKSFHPNFSNKNRKEILFVFVTSDYWPISDIIIFSSFLIFPFHHLYQPTLLFLVWSTFLPSHWFFFPAFSLPVINLMSLMLLYLTCYWIPMVLIINFFLGFCS